LTDEAEDAAVAAALATMRQQAYRRGEIWYHAADGRYTLGIPPINYIPLLLLDGEACPPPPRLRQHVPQMATISSSRTLTTDDL
jgi:hypothetical protein